MQKNHKTNSKNLVATETAHADFTAFSNRNSFTGNAFVGADATAGTPTERLVADDMTPVAGTAGFNGTSDLMK